MRYITTFLISYFFALSFHATLAQEIEIIPSTGIDVSPYISDWENYQGQFFVDFLREEEFSRQIYLQAELIQNGSRSLLIAKSAPYEVPSGLWELRVDNPDVFEWPEVRLNSDWQNVSRVARLPEGLYEVCIKAFDLPTNQLLGEACADFDITLPQAPQIIFPENEATVEADNFVVEWTPVEGYDGRYIITLVEQYLTQAGQEAIESNPPFHTDEVFGLTSYLFPVNLIDFNPEANYCVRVQAIDEENRPASTNNGYSDVICVDILSSGFGGTHPPNIPLATVNCPYPTSEIPADNISINWEPVPGVSNYDLYVYKTEDATQDVMINLADEPYYSKLGVGQTEVSFGDNENVFFPNQDYAVLVTPADYEMPSGNINDVYISPSTYFKTKEEKEYEELQRIFAILEMVRKKLEAANKEYSNNDLVKELRTYYIFGYLMSYLAQPVEGYEFSQALENIVSGKTGGIRDYQFDDYRNALVYLEQLLEYLKTYGNFSDEKKSKLGEIQNAIAAAMDGGITKENFKSVVKRISKLFEDIKVNHNKVYLEITKYLGAKGIEILVDKFLISKLAGADARAIMNAFHHLKKIFMDLVNLIKFVSLDKPKLERAEYEYYFILQALMNKALSVTENGEYLFRIPACGNQKFVLFTSPGNAKTVKKMTIKLETYCLVDDGKGGKKIVPCETPIVDGENEEYEIEIKGKDLEKHVIYDEFGCPIVTYVYELTGKVCCRKNCMVVAKITTQYKDGSVVEERLFMGVTIDPNDQFEEKDDENDDDDTPVNTPNPFNQQPDKGQIPITEVPGNGNNNSGNGKKDPCEEFDKKYEAMTQEINDCQDDCDKIQDKIDQLEADKAKLEAKNSGNKDEIDALQKRMDEIQKEIDKKIAEMQKIVGDRGKVVEYSDPDNMKGDHVGEQGLGFEFGNGYDMRDAYDDYEKKTGKSIGEGVAEINDLQKQRDKLKKEKEKKEKDGQKEKGKHQKAIDNLQKQIDKLKKQLKDCRRNCGDKKEARDQFGAANPECHKRKKRQESAEKALRQASNSLNETRAAVDHLNEKAKDQQARAQGACDPDQANDEPAQNAVEEILEAYREAQDLYVAAAKALHAGDYEKAKQLAQQASELIEGIKNDLPSVRDQLASANQALWNQPRPECESNTQESFQRNTIRQIHQIRVVPHSGNQPNGNNPQNSLIMSQNLKQLLEVITSKANAANLVNTPVNTQININPQVIGQNPFTHPQNGPVQLPFPNQINQLDIYVDYAVEGEMLTLSSICDGCRSQLQSDLIADQNLTNQSFFLGSIPWEGEIKNQPNGDPELVEFLAQELTPLLSSFILENTVFK